VYKARAVSASAFPQNGRYCLYQNFGRASLDHVSVRTRVLGLRGNDLVIVHRYDHDFRFWRKLPYLPGGFDAAHHGHCDVHEHQVRLQRERFFNGLLPISRLAAHFPAGLRLDKAAQP
jgi:hypothetical protein